MLNCIAVDDEPLSLEVLRTYIQPIANLALVKSFTSTRKAKEYLNDYPVDLIFLDIDMPDMDGVSFYRSLKCRPGVIFITAYGNYAVDGFAVNAIDYLLKPIDPARLQEAISRALNRKQSLLPLIAEPQISVRCNYQLKNLLLNDIIYIEGLNDYVKVYTAKAPQPVLTLMSMKEVMMKLPPHQFIRIHRSYIIPVSRITCYSSRNIQLGNIALPIGDTYKEAIRHLLLKK